LGDTNDRLQPTRIKWDLPTGFSIATVLAGASHTLVLLKNEQNETQLYAWGYNFDGQLGLGDTNERLQPTRINWDLPTGFSIATILAGAWHTLVLLKNEHNETQLYAWGNNRSGQLGLGDTNERLQPTRINWDLPTGFSIATVLAGASHTLVLLKNEENETQLYAWGYNFDGQLGLGDKNNRLQPTRLLLTDNFFYSPLLQHYAQYKEKLNNLEKLDFSQESKFEFAQHKNN